MQIQLWQAKKWPYPCVASRTLAYHIGPLCTECNAARKRIQKAAWLLEYNTHQWAFYAYWLQILLLVGLFSLPLIKYLAKGGF
jgi:hypothetical protein